MSIKTLNIKTHSQVEFQDITFKIIACVKEAKVKEGVCYLFIPHTTAGITINENADFSVKEDILKEINKIVPFKNNYTHLEGNAAAHIKTSLIGFSQVILIENSQLVLGTWQGIYFCEFDGPRNRKILVKIIEG